ncbi:MAG: thioredoxin domain-containing protein [Desulfobacterales bacterium]|nr:thioredoxin domain-containing protein [Desulfobacterales bacterium]
MALKAPLIIRCADCGASNKLPPEKAGLSAKCGKCGSVLKNDAARAAPADVFLLRCTQCGTKNRLPTEHIKSGAKCGKCKVPLQTADLFNGEALMITDSNFDMKVTKSPLPVLLFAWAPWCPSCRTFIPIIDNYAAVASGRVRVGKLNVDANPGLSSKFNILSVPFVFIFDNGRLKESMPGAMQQHEIMMKMAHYL